MDNLKHRKISATAPNRGTKMIIDGLNLLPTSTVEDFVEQNVTTLPTDDLDVGRQVYLTVTDGDNPPGTYVYTGTSWNQLAATNADITSQLPAFSGDVTSTAGTSVLTLNTVNSDVGTYAGITVNGKGLVTAAVTKTTLAGIWNY